jgi:predicted AAA+ superfamily ATPase
MLILMSPSADPRLLAHNLQWQGREAFLQQDPLLRRLRQQSLQHAPALIERLPLGIPGIYTLVGGRQVGKSTLLKQAMQRLLVGKRAAPTQLAYVTCEPFADAEDLRSALDDLLSRFAEDSPAWLFLDEVTYVDGWDRTIKFLADAGRFERVFVLLTGSDRILIEDSMKRLPGRRGRAALHDFHLRPLSFAEFCTLRGRVDRRRLLALASAPIAEPPPATALEAIAALTGECHAYHLTGGFLPAINDLERDGEVAPVTFRTYADWIRGDLLRLDRNERYLREVVSSISIRQGSQVTWNALAKTLSIDHPKTVADYVGILERMDAVVVVPALAEDKLAPAPKKGRKVFFADPFIHRALLAWLGRPDGALPADERLQRDLEGTFAAHVARRGEVFYLKGHGEVDVAWLEQRRIQAIEVKWSRQLRPEELKEIRRRGRGVIAARVDTAGTLDGIPVAPAALVLLRLCGPIAPA